MRPRAGFLGAFVTIAAAGVASAQPPALDGLIRDAAAYVERFAERFSNVVAEEVYVQETTSNRVGSSIGGQRRELRSDFLLVKPAGSSDWIPFRDVFAVDGSAVRGREERLARLFIDASPAALEQANAIAAESSRYNLGAGKRTVNNPVLALAFMQPHLVSRFAFTLGRRDPAVGEQVWIVEARETARPTLVRGAYDRDMPSRLRFWIDVAGGAVLRTELSLNDSTVSARVTTDFNTDDAFGVALPVRMSETYNMTGMSTMTGRATYGRFRRFGVSTEEAIRAR